METKQPNLAAFNEWICVKSMFDNQDMTSHWVYTEGQKYWFHEDTDVDTDNFKLVVDEEDTPIKKLVRWD